YRIDAGTGQFARTSEPHGHLESDRARLRREDVRLRVYRRRRSVEVAGCGLSEAGELCEPVEQVRDVQLASHLVVAGTYSQIHQGVRRHAPDDGVLIHPQLNRGRGLVRPVALDVRLPFSNRVQVEPRDHASLEVRGDRQLCTAASPQIAVDRRAIRKSMHRRNAILVRARWSLGTDLLGYAWVDPLEVEAREQFLRRRPLKTAFQPRDARACGVLDDGDAVETEERILEVVPVLPEERAVPAQVMVEELRLPADLVILEEIGGVRRDARLRRAVHTAWPEALGVGRVDHRVRRELVGEVAERHITAVGEPLGKVGAGRELDGGRNEVAGGILEAMLHA